MSGTLSGWLDDLRAIADGTNDDPDALECLGDFHEEAAAFLHGRCHLMALALHETTDLPIGALLGGCDDKSWLVHAYVVDGNEIVDAKGRRSLDEMLRDFSDEEADAVAIGPEEVVRLGEGRRAVRKASLPFLAEARTAAPLIAAIATRDPRPATVGPGS